MQEAPAEDSGEEQDSIQEGCVGAGSGTGRGKRTGRKELDRELQKALRGRGGGRGRGKNGGEECGRGAGRGKSKAEAEAKAKAKGKSKTKPTATVGDMPPNKRTRTKQSAIMENFLDPGGCWQHVVAMGDDELQDHFRRMVKFFNTFKADEDPPGGLTGERTQEIHTRIRIDKYGKPKVPYYGIRCAFGVKKALGTARMPMRVNDEDGVETQAATSLWAVRYVAVICAPWKSIGLLLFNLCV